MLKQELDQNEYLDFFTKTKKLAEELTSPPSVLSGDIKIYGHTKPSILHYQSERKINGITYITLSFRSGYIEPQYYSDYFTTMYSDCFQYRITVSDHLLCNTLWFCYVDTMNFLNL